MKNSKLIFGMLLMVFSSVSVQAQERPEKGQKQIAIERYKEQLKLSEDQVESLKSMKAKYSSQKKEIRNNDAQSKSEKMRLMADILENQQAEMAEILDESQLAEWKKIKEEMKAQRKKKGGKRKGRGMK